MIKKWVFPFPGIDGKELPDTQAFFKALAKSEDGFYPMGANSLWHGGIHFGAGTASSLKQDGGVRCIADGEVVAYRVDTAPSRIIYMNGREAQYTTGFVLVRHTLVLPPAPQPPSNPPSSDATPPPTPPEDTLVFFSLYMHTQSQNVYRADPTLKRPAFWNGEGAAYRVGNKCEDKNQSMAPGKVGINIRNAAHVVVGLLPRGAIVSLGAASTTKPNYFMINQVISGATGGHVPNTTPIGYVYKEALDTLRDIDAGALNAVYVLPQPAPVAAGALLGHVGRYQRYSDVASGPLNRPLLHVEVFAGADLPAFIARSRQRAATLDAKEKSRLLVNVGTKVCKPAAADSTVAAGSQLKETSDSPKSGIYVKARRIETKIVTKSELSAYNSQKKTYKHSNGETVTFTGRFFGATDTQVTTEQNFANAHNYTRREIVLLTGEAVWVERSSLSNSTTARTAWTQFPLQLRKPSSTTIGQSRVFTRAELDALPEHALDQNKVRWYKLTNVGWICEKDHPGTAWTSPWDWAGFDIIEENSQLSDQYARYVHQQGGSVEAEVPAFKQRADAVDGGPLLTSIRRAIDKMEHEDGILTVDELRKALTTPWLADRLSRLIVKYESEWGGDFSKWNALDGMMRDGLSDWTAEKLRIKKLAFWSKVTGIAGFPGDPKVHFLHPGGVIGNFRSKFGITVSMLQKIFTGGDPIFLKKIAEDINYHLDEYKLDTKLRLSHFFAQVREEAGANCKVEEGFNYSPARLRDIFGYFSSNSSEADLYGRTASHPANSVEIANRAYGSRLGNGNISSGEGWMYRGRGLKQLTGKANYKDFNDKYKTIWSDDAVNFIVNPDLLIEAKYAVRSAVFFWLRHRLYEIADQGATDSQVNSITAIINLHTDSYTNRRAHFKNIWDGNVFDEI